MSRPPLAVLGLAWVALATGALRVADGCRSGARMFTRALGRAPSGLPSRAGWRTRGRQSLAVLSAVFVVTSAATAPVVAVGGSAGADGPGPAALDAPADGAADDDPGSTGGGGATAASHDSPDAGTAAPTGGTGSTDRANTGKQPWYFYHVGVNTANGNLFLSTEDISTGARGGDIAFVRSYNSHLSAEHSPLGFGWTHNYNMRLVEAPDGSVVFVDTDGARYNFTATGGGYETPPGLQARLTSDGSGHVLWFTDGRRHVFDGEGVLQRITDANDNSVHLEYTDGNLTRIRDDSGQHLDLRYNANGRITEIVGPLNRTIDYQYDTGNLVEVTDPMGTVAAYSYYSNHKLQMVDTRSQTRTYRYYSESDRVRCVGGPDGCSDIGYTFAYDYANDTVDIRSSISEVRRTVELNDASNPVNITVLRDASSNVTGERTSTEMRWEDMNRVRVHNSSGNYSFSYDAYGNVVKRVGPDGETVTFDWRTVDTADAYWSRLANRNGPDGDTTRYTYDDDGNRIEVIRPDGATREMTYDEHGSLRSETDFLGHETRYTYDEHGFRTSVTSPTGATTNFTHDAAGRITNTTNPRNNTIGYEYNARDKVVKVIDPTGNATEFDYNTFGDLSSATSPTGQQIPAQPRSPTENGPDVTWSGDSLTLDGDGYELTRRFDDRNRVTSETVDYGSFERTVEYSYDDDGNLQRLDVPGGETTYEYDDRGNVVRIEGPNGTWVNYTYNAVGWRTNAVYSNGVNTTYEYDADGRVTGITVVGPAQSSDSSGSGTSTSTPTSTSTSTPENTTSSPTPTPENTTSSPTPTPENTSTPTSTSTSTPENTTSSPTPTPENTSTPTPSSDPGSGTSDADATQVLLNLTYTYDPMGNVASVTDRSGTTTYGYDALNRLINVTYPTGKTIEYTYDAAGNRLSKTVNGTETTRYRYNASGELVSAGGTDYEYDSHGNMVEKSAGGNVTEYRYGPQGRLVEVDPATGPTARFDYLPNGERFRKTVGGNTTNYLYSSFDVVATFDEQGALQRRYVHGPRIDEQVAMIRDGTPHFYHHDATQSVRALSDASGAVANRYRYAPYGTLRTATERVANPYRFTGRQHDSEIGLYYNRKRYYDPSTARFTRRDPAGASAGVNPYGYADGNPINKYDPWGLDAWGGPVEGGGGEAGIGIIGAGLECVTAQLVNANTGQACSLTTCTAKLGFILGASAEASINMKIRNGPRCGEGLGGFASQAVLEGELGAGFGCSGGAGFNAAGSVSAEGGCGTGAGASGGLSGQFSYSWVHACNCQGPCQECDDDCEEGEDCDDDDDDDDPPGDDHPDDNHDPSVLSFDRPVERSTTPRYEYNASVAVLDNGFDEELRYFLASVDASDYQMVDVDVPQARLNDYDVLVVPTGGLMGLSSFDPFEQRLERFVEHGGTLVVLPQQRGYHFGPVPDTLKGFGWVEDQSCQFGSVGVSEYCPIVASQSGDTADANVDGYFTEYPERAEVLLTRTKNGQPAMLKYGYGNGTVIATNAYTDWAYGHNAGNVDGRNILRDAVTWGRGPGNLSTVAPGENATVTANVTSYVDVRTDRVEVQLYRPEESGEVVCTRRVGTDCREGRYVPDPPRNATVSTVVAPLGNGSVTADVPLPNDSMTGVWDVGYALHNDSHGKVQEISEAGEQVAVSTFEPTADGYTTSGSNISVSVTSDDEHYARGSNATFEITVRNRGNRTETVDLWWSFPHNHDGEPEDDALYGASTTRPAAANSSLNRTLTVGAGGQETFTYRVPVTTFDRLWLQARQTTDDDPQYVGRFSRAFFTFHPGFDVDATTDRDRYGPGSTARLDLNLTGNDNYDRSVTVDTTVLAPDNTLVDRQTRERRVRNGSVNLSRSVSLPTAPQDGTYIAITEVLDESGDRVGYGTTTFEVPFDVRASLSLPETMRSSNRVTVNLSNVDDSALDGVTLDAELVDPAGDTVWNDSRTRDLGPNGGATLAFDDVTVGNGRFGEYRFRYTVEYGDASYAFGRTIEKAIVADAGFNASTYSQRDDAGFSLRVVNDGGFEIDGPVTIEVDGADFSATRSLDLDPGGNATLNGTVPVPTDADPGRHEAVVTAGPDDTELAGAAYTVPESDLSISVPNRSADAGGDVVVDVSNTGGVDTDAECEVTLLGPQGEDFSDGDIDEAVRTGETVSTGFGLPEDAISGQYFAVVSCTDEKPYAVFDLETTERTESIDVDGLDADLEQSTDADTYGSNDTVTVQVNVSNAGDAIENGTLQVEIVDPSVARNAGGGSGNDSQPQPVSLRVQPVDWTDVVEPSGAGDGPALDAAGSVPDAGSAPVEATAPVGTSRAALTPATPALSAEDTGPPLVGDLVGAVPTVEAASLVDDIRAAAAVDAGPGAGDGADADPASPARIRIEPGNETVWEDRVIETDEDIVINATGNLTLRNTTIRFLEDDDGDEERIEVKGGGELHVVDGSVIRGEDTSRYSSYNHKNYRFQVRENATFELRDSTVNDAGTGGGYRRPLDIGGLYVATDDVTIENASLYSELGDASLILHGTEGVTVSNSNVSNDDTAILLSGAVDTELREMDVRVHDDSIWAVEISDASDTELHESTLVQGGVDVQSDSTDTEIRDVRIDADWGGGGIKVQSRATGTVVRRTVIDQAGEVGGYRPGDYDGIRIQAANATVVDTVINGSDRNGVRIDGNNATLRNNTVENNSKYDVYIRQAENATLRGNDIGSRFHVRGSWGSTAPDPDRIPDRSYFTHDIDASNTVDDGTVTYLTDPSDRTVSGDGGAVWLINATNVTVTGETNVGTVRSDNVTVADVTVPETRRYGVYAGYSDDVHLRNVTARNVTVGAAIFGTDSGGTTTGHRIVESDFTDAGEYGIYGYFVGDTVARDNVVTNAEQTLLELYSFRGENLTATDNRLRGDGETFDGMVVTAPHSTVADNVVRNVSDGIIMGENAYNSTIGGNLIEAESADEADGIEVRDRDITVHNNTVRVTSEGIRTTGTFYGAKDTVIRDNRVSGAMNGIEISSDDATVRGNDVSNSRERAVYVNADRNATVADTTGQNNTVGIDISGGANARLLGNDIAGRDTDISLFETTNATLRSNTLPAGGLRVYTEDDQPTPAYFDHDIDTSNTRRGDPVYYVVDSTTRRTIRDAGDAWLVNVSGVSVVGAHDATLINSTNVSVRDVSVADGGVTLWETDDSRLENVTVRNNSDADIDYRGSEDNDGLELRAADNNTIVDVTATDHGHYGVEFDGAGNNTIRDVTLRANTEDQLYVDRDSRNNTVANVSVRNTPRYANAIWLEGDYDGTRANTTLRNVTAVADGPDEGGVYVESSGNTITDVTVRNYTSIPVEIQGNNNTVEGVRAVENEQWGLEVDGRHTVLVDAVVRNNSQSDSRYYDYGGIRVWGRNVTVRNATLVDNGDDGITFHGSNGTLVNSTVAEHDVDGVHVGEDAHRTVLRGLTARDNTNGVDIDRADNVTVAAGTFEANWNGLHVEGAHNTTIRRNVIRNSSYAGLTIETYRGSYGNERTARNLLVYDNYFHNPDGREVDAGGLNNTSWNVSKRPGPNIIGGPFLGGNFWATYGGQDTNGDGLGDVGIPFDAGGELATGDRRPLVQQGTQNRVVWKRNVSVNVSATTEETVTVEVPASELGGTGKRKLASTLVAENGQQIAYQDPSFYLFDGDATLTMELDEDGIYTPNETVTVTGTLTHNGSSAETYTLTVGGGNGTLVNETVTLDPGETHSYETTTTATESFTLTAEAGDVTVEEAVTVREASVNATLIAPDLVGRGDFVVGAEVENDDTVPVDVNVSLAPVDETWNVTLAPGETRRLTTETNVSADTDVTATLTGDVDQTLDGTVTFGEDATTSTAPRDTYAPGTIAVPYTVTNDGNLPTRFNATFTVGNRTQVEAVYVPVGSSASGTLVFDLPVGTHRLRTQTPFTDANTTLTVAEPDQLNLSVSAAANATDGALPTSVTVRNVGPNDINGTLRVSSPVAGTTRQIDIGSGNTTSVAPTLPIPEGATPGEYNATVAVTRGGETLVERTVRFTVPGTNLSLVSASVPDRAGLGDQVTVNATVVNTGTTAGETTMNVTAPGIAETAIPVLIAPGERRNVTTTFALPDDLSEDSYEVQYGLGETDRRTSVYVAGADVNATAELDRRGYTENQTANLTLTVENAKDMRLDLFARVAFNDNETVREFTLNGSETKTLEARVPIEFGGDEKIFYGIYADTGRSLYISGVYPHRDRPNVTLSTDQQIYEPGDTATITVDTERAGEVALTTPNGSWNGTVDGTKRVEFVVPALGSGTYYVHYSLDNQSYSYPFDVDGYGVRVSDASIDAGRYEPGERVSLSLDLAPTRNVSGNVTASVRSMNGTTLETSTTPVDLDTRGTEVTLAAPLPANDTGSRILRYSINGTVDDRQVLRTQGRQYFSVVSDTSGGPTAAVAPLSGTPIAGESVTLDAGRSAGGTDPIDTYEWDIDGDDTYELSGETVTHTFGSAGDRTVALRVTDTNGRSDTTETTVDVRAVDDAPPTLDVLAPGDGTTFGAGTESVTLRVAYSDAAGSVDPGSISVAFDGANVTSEATINGTHVTYTATGLSNDSAHAFTVAAADDARTPNRANETVDFEIAAAGGSGTGGGSSGGGSSGGGPSGGGSSGGGPSAPADTDGDDDPVAQTSTATATPAATATQTATPAADDGDGTTEPETTTAEPETATTATGTVIQEPGAPAIPGFTPLQVLIALLLALAARWAVRS